MRENSSDYLYSSVSNLVRISEISQVLVVHINGLVVCNLKF